MQIIKKSNEPLLSNIQDSLFSSQKGRLPKLAKREFSQIWDLRKLANHKTLLCRSYPAKTNDSILHKSQTPIFGSFFPHFSENENFPKKSGSVTFEHLWTTNKISVKTN